MASRSAQRDDAQVGQSRGAQESLLENTGATKTTGTEATPLLGNGGDSPNGENANEGNEEYVWQRSTDFEGLGWWNTPSISWLIPPFFLIAVAFGGLVVPKLNIILDLVCQVYLEKRSDADPTISFTPVVLGSENPQCREIAEVQSLATQFTLYLTIIAGTLSAVTTPKLGALSDRYGRKRLLVISSLGLFLSEIVMIFAFKYPDVISYKWLLAGAIFDGIGGSFTAAMSLIYSYASDCTPPAKRGVSFGYLHACLFAGIAVGPLVAAFLIKLSGTVIIIFYVTLIVHASFMLFVFFVIPESLAQKHQSAARDKFAADNKNVARDGYTLLWALKQGNILEPLKILWPTGPGTSSHLRSNLLLLAAVDTIIFGVSMGALTVIVYYAGYQFGWDTAATSEFVSIVNIARVAVLILVLPLLNRIVRIRRAKKEIREFGFAAPERNSGADILDLNFIRGSIFIEVIGFSGYAAAHTGSLFIASGIIAALGGVGSPILQSALTKHVPHNKVGQLLGATGLLHSLARIISPTIFNLIYSKTVGTLPQTVFIALASCFVLAFLASWFIRPNVYFDDDANTAATPARPSDRADADAEALADEDVAGF